MRIGIVLPSFERTSHPAAAAFAAADRAGLHGCFCYDHLWPIGWPGRPALAPFPLLASLAGSLVGRRSEMVLGTLVARVGLVPDEVLERELRTLKALLGDRLVAGIGTGDHKSAAENLAYGVAFPPAAERRERLGALAARLTASGITTWIGGGSEKTNELAFRTGAVLNLWAASVAEVASQASRGEVTWGGNLPRDPVEAGALLAGLSTAGATWAVLGWPGAIGPIVAAARAGGVTLGMPRGGRSARPERFG